LRGGDVGGYSSITNTIVHVGGKSIHLTWWSRRSGSILRWPKWTWTTRPHVPRWTHWSRTTHLSWGSHRSSRRTHWSLHRCTRRTHRFHWTQVHVCHLIIQLPGTWRSTRSGSHGSWRAKWSRLTLPAWLLGRLHHLMFCSNLCTFCQVLHTMLGCVSVTFSSTSAQDTSTNHSEADSVPTNQRTGFRGNWQRTTKLLRSCAISCRSESSN